jgi:hypothetical protein
MRAGVVPRDLYNVRTLPHPDAPEDSAPSPLSADEERRFQAVLFHDLGNEIADRAGPAFPPARRRTGSGWCGWPND